MTKKITIITTRQNFKWISMQEVLPSLERCWPEAALSHSYEYRLINIDDTPLRSFMSFLFQSEAIVIIAFNETIAKFMREVRSKLKLPIPFVFHLHGLATIGLWPFHHFNLMDSLNQGDVFIGTCEGDRKCLEIIFEEFSFFRIPYPFYPLELKPQESSQLAYVYIGRISDQKNIHRLIEAYHLLVKEQDQAPDLLIYGAEDFLGSPNMGITSSECLKSLEQLIDQLKLKKRVHLKGFKNREDIYSEIGSHHIALSASTHSDENFGMAIMRSLSLGARAVLTHWGGHIHFQEQFPEQVLTVPVSLGASSPEADAQLFKEAMQKSWEQWSLGQSSLTQKVPEYFTPQKISQQFVEVLHTLRFSEKKCQLTSTALDLYRQKNDFTQQGNIQKIYHSYTDAHAIRFLRAYQ